jgi:hypothetical protein
VDPVRLFVKNEPHSARKLEQRAYRLISSVSVVDQIVSRLLFGRLNELEIANFQSIPSQPGMGLEDEDFHRMGSWLSQGSQLVSTDISGFDWNVTLWQLLDEAQVRCLLYGLSPVDKAWSLIHSRAWALAHSVLVLSDGVLLAQQRPGLQKSGDYTTSSTNSRIMAMLLLYSGATSMWTMGDDAVSIGTDETALRSFLDVKEFSSSAAEFTFCAHRVRGTSEGTYEVSFQNWRKSAYRLLCVCPSLTSEEEQCQHVFQFCHSMRFDKEARDVVLRHLKPFVKAGTGAYIDEELAGTFPVLSS